MKQKVLGIFCHPDDEILCGWPIFQSDKYKKHLIICCDDSMRHRPGRVKALQEVCQQEDIHLVDILSEDNNFYSLSTRRADYLLTNAISNIENALEKAIKQIKPDFIFTHNPVGFYGHGSHRLLFQIVSQNSLVKNLLFTDICCESNHWSSKEIPQFIWNIFYKSNLWKVNSLLNMNFYNRCKTIYNKCNAWTYSKNPIEECGLYILKSKGN